ncbi:hypothetical protein B4U80_05706 [Leptotrombidium deliense]|uniref:Uncharacterized protein n=1 Tax=Leptotrombidium deliense TaxID=299467 RepID=A0A443SQ12_9ACAR|nr:hypothetical protein B4U80_05706 [Leptotrombidium deliense]
MHPEANPQKLAPTNRTPRTGKKFGKRRYFDVSSSVVESIPKTIALGTSSSPQSQQYILRTITYPSNNDSTSSASLFDGESAPLTPITTNGTIVKSPTLKTVSVVSNTAPAATTTADGVPLVSCDEITTAVVNMLVKDCRPVCVVEGKGFEELLRVLAPGYKLPDSDRLKVLVKKRYEEVRRNLILRAMEEE